MPLDIAVASSTLVARADPRMYPIIMLRDPLERVVSFANFLKIDQDAFESFPHRLSCNQQTLLINGIPGSGGGCGVGITLGEGYWRAWEYWKGSCYHDKDYAVTEGRRRLNDLFYFVGITEDFVGSMFLLQRTFAWGESSVKMAFQKSMKSFCDGECKKRYKVRDLTNHTRSIIYNNEDCDRALWIHARTLLTARLENMAPTDLDAFAKFKMMAKEQEQLGSEVIKMQKRRLRINTHKTMGVVKVRTLTEARALAAEQRRQRNAIEVGGYEEQTEALMLPRLAHEILDSSKNSTTGTQLLAAAVVRPKCGDNSVIEEHITSDFGDVCRMASGAFYCPLGCAHIKKAPHCSANIAVNVEPCRHRNITRAFHIRDQIRTLTVF